MNSELKTSQARANFAIAAPIALPESAAEGDLQWMPPGPQDITCWVNGSPRRLKFTVTARDAELLDAQLQKIIAKANAGKGDKPLTDYNHDDGAASGRPIRFTWGGDDPKTGGIRLANKWTGKAKSSIADEEFDRFSPQWDFDEKTGDITGIGVNLGGLVNKAAFQNISPVSAKAAQGLEDRFTASGTATDQLMAKAAAASNNTGISFAAALDRICTQNNDLYRRSMNEKQEPEQISAENPALIAQAREVSRDRGVSIVAAVALVTGGREKLYREHTVNVAQAAKTPIPAPNVAGMAGQDHPFIIFCQKCADELGTTFHCGMLEAATRDHELYNSYLRFLSGRA